MRERSAALWDQRSLTRPLATLVLQPSTKPLLPLYDEDTQLAYLIEKGDSFVRWVDADPSSARPLSELGSVSLPAQITGCALLPKRRLKVMSGEIARVHLVAENPGTGTGAAVIPVAHVAPRRSYLDFHADLFPDTRAPLPAQTLAQWMANKDASVPRMSLDPARIDESLASLCRASGVQAQTTSVADSHALVPAPIVARSAAVTIGHGDKDNKATDCEPPSSKSASTHEEKSSSVPKPEPTAALTPSNGAPMFADTLRSASNDIEATTTVGPPLERPDCVAGRRPFGKPDHVRFKYLEGFLYRPTDHFTGLPELNTRFPQENDPLRVSAKFIAFSCAGIGGQVGVVCRDSPGRASAKLARIVHGADIVSMEFDPFDGAVLATAGTDCKLQLWRIPDSPLNDESFFELEEYIHVTADRVYQIRFHPCAKGVVAVLASDAGQQAIYVYHGLVLHFIVGRSEDGIHSFAWSPNGEQIALTTKKSKEVRVYDVRTQELLSKGPSMSSIRPCRIAWLGNSRLCLAGFGPGSQRELAVYNAEDLSKPVAKVAIDVGPGVLVPIVDDDCSIIYLDDRGSRLTHAFEVFDDKLVALSKFESAQPSLGMAALPKAYADIAKCELLRAWRLCSHTVESIGFRVPRKRPEFFQDDIFPDTIDCATPSIDAAAWINGVAATPRFIQLCPQGMTRLSEAPPEAVHRRVFAATEIEQVDNTSTAIDAMLSRVDDNGSDACPNDSGSDWDD
ncbi:hypothetical protein H4218_006302 [Coemansia sp. IMI 209128]|nr:hypothetical protein GGI10_004178 [Coemansia sp. RSA 2530]KAJ2692646.1 hypothetical protein H4218_006302 [Coemansia sp. IMI 209128]